MPTASERTRSTVAGPLYCDASALAKLFLPEAGSDALNRLLVGRGDVVVSDLAITEVVSALAWRAREGALTPAAARRAHQKMLATLSAGSMRRVDMVAATHREAERLLFGARETPLRAGDALHLALALDARVGALVTYDRMLSRAATHHGLTVWPDAVD